MVFCGVRSSGKQNNRVNCMRSCSYSFAKAAHAGFLQLRYPTFLKHWNRKWTAVLKFRAKSEFSSCDVCMELKAQQLGLQNGLPSVPIGLRFQDKTLTMDVRLGALKLYRERLVSQYSDRCSYWALKDISGDVTTGVLCMTTDGADQASQLFM